MTSSIPPGYGMGASCSMIAFGGVGHHREQGRSPVTATHPLVSAGRAPDRMSETGATAHESRMPSPRTDLLAHVWAPRTPGGKGCQGAVNGEGSSDPRLVVTIGTVTALLQDGVIDTGHRAAPPLAGPGPHAIGVAAREGPRLAGQPVHGPDLRDLLAPGAERVRAVAGGQARMIDRACDRTEPTPRPVRYRSRCRTYRPVRPGSLLAQPSSRNRSRTSLRTSLLTGWIPVETGTPNSV